MSGEPLVLPLAEGQRPLLWHHQRLYEGCASDVLGDGRRRMLYRCKTEDCQASAVQVESDGEIVGVCLPCNLYHTPGSKYR